MPSAFICHSWRDKALARRLATELERHGVGAWIDDRAIKVGHSLLDSVQSGLERADFVIVLLSRVALRRPWVHEELKAALTLELERKTSVVLPAILEKVRLPLFLRDKRYADFSGRFGIGFDALLEAFQEHGKPGTPLKLETTKCVVRLEMLKANGKLVRYTKTQTVRCISGTVGNYIEAFSADGHVRGFSVTPGRIRRRWTESGTLHLETTFPAPLRARQSITRVFRCNWVDAFTRRDEYWDQRQHHPSKNVELQVVFLKSRPPQEWSVEEREGALLRTSTLKARRTTLDGKPMLRLCIKSPRLLHSYILRWRW